MNDRQQDHSDIGQRISSALQDAVESMDFGQLNKVVTDSVSGAIEEVRRQVNTVSQSVNSRNAESNTKQKTDRSDSRTYTSDRYRYTYRQPGSRTMYSSQKKSQTAVKVQESTGVRIDRSGKVGGVLRVVFGSIGTGGFAILALANLLVWAFEQTLAAAVPVGIMAILCMICSGFIAGGSRILRRLKRAERYAKLGGKRKFLELEDIARNTGRSIKKVRADVRRMLRLGIFPEGHMDSQGKCLILDDETWQQYKLTQKEYENKKALQVKNDAVSDSEVQDKPKADVKDGPDAQAARIIREGQAYMDRLRQLNIEIPGEVISNKLYQLDYLLTRIFAVIRQHPEKCPQLRRFMEYYLPTTVKLVESYADFDRAGITGENISAGKAEIEKTMDTINQAFEKLLDDIYQNAAMETAADAQVLKTLLAQDGYTGSDFDI